MWDAELCIIRGDDYGTRSFLEGRYGGSSPLFESCPGDGNKPNRVVKPSAALTRLKGVLSAIKP